MLKGNRKRIILVLFFGVLLVLGVPLINSKYHEWVKSHQKMYCYSNFRGAANPAHIVSKNNKMALVEYYEKVEKDPNANPVITFGIKTIPQYTPVYVLDYSSDSLIAKIISYAKWSPKMGSSYTKGWVYVNTLHENAPVSNSEKVK